MAAPMCGKVPSDACVIHTRWGIAARSTRTIVGHAMTNDERWTSFLRGIASDDPEWAAYLATLSPKTPLSQAVKGYVRILTSRYLLTPEELAAAGRILEAMEEHGFTDADQFIDALDRGEIGPPNRRGRGRIRAKQAGWEPGGA